MIPLRAHGHAQPATWSRPKKCPHACEVARACDECCQRNGFAKDLKVTPPMDAASVTRRKERLR